MVKVIDKTNGYDSFLLPLTAHCHLPLAQHNAADADDIYTDVDDSDAHVNADQSSHTIYRCVYGGLSEGNNSILSVSNQPADDDPTAMFGDDFGFSTQSSANKFPDEP